MVAYKGTAHIEGRRDRGRFLKLYLAYGNEWAKLTQNGRLVRFSGFGLKIKNSVKAWKNKKLGMRKTRTKEEEEVVFKISNTTKVQSPYRIRVKSD